MEAGEFLGSVIKEQRKEIMLYWHQALKESGGNYTRGLIPERELNNEMEDLLSGLFNLLKEDNSRFGFDETHAIAGFLRTASQVRAARGFTTEESLLFLQTCKESLISVVQKIDPENVKMLATCVLSVEKVMDRCILILVKYFVLAREEIISRQSTSLRELSTPVIKLWDSVLLLPLIGIVDSARALQISERLLSVIGETEAAITIIDVTGVPVMDTGVARHLIKTITASHMLGTQVIMTGISPDTAQTIVKLGIDLSSIPTRGTLRSGITLAFNMLNKQIVDKENPL